MASRLNVSRIPEQLSMQGYVAIPCAVAAKLIAGEAMSQFLCYPHPGSVEWKGEYATRLFKITLEPVPVVENY